jgi:hypothetical protein
MTCEFGVYPPGTELDPEYEPVNSYVTNCIDPIVHPIVQSAFNQSTQDESEVDAIL